MAQAARARDIRFDPTGMRQFLPHSVAASLGVLGFPSAVLFSTLLLTEPNPPVLLCSLLSLALSSLASVVGARLWQKHPKSKEISFGDLMFWSWWGRKRAESRLSRGTAALGLDRRGTPVGQLTLTRAEQLRVLRELNDALESKDPYTRGHSKRVERHVFRMANSMGLSVHEIEELRLAAALHDVGKIRVPDHILRKPGKLTAKEFDLMKDHPSVGAWMLSFVGSQDVIEAVRYHHERWDGRGYPDGMSATDIPLFARMIAVADTYDAITSTRPYRAKAARDRAMSELKASSGSQLDPMCVEAFCASLPAPVPVAAFLFLLPAGIKRLVRELAVTSRRAGLQAIASGVGAASAAVIVTTPVVAPALGAKPVTSERTVGTISAEGTRDASAAAAAEGGPGNEVAGDAEDERAELERLERSGKAAGQAARLVAPDGELPTSTTGLESVPEVQAEPDPADLDIPAGTDPGTGKDTSNESPGKSDGRGGPARGNSGNSGNGNSGKGSSNSGSGKGSSGNSGSGKGNSGTGKGNGNSGNSGGGTDSPGTGNSGSTPGSGNAGNGGGGSPGGGTGGSGGNGNPGGGSGTENPGTPGGNSGGGNGGSGNAGGNSGSGGGGRGNSGTAEPGSGKDRSEDPSG